MSTIKGITTLSSLRIDAIDKKNQTINGFYLPQLTVIRRNDILFNANPTKSILREGALIFTTNTPGAAPNTTFGITQIYHRGGWGGVFTSPTTATGVGLEAGSSMLRAPNGPAADVEDPENEQVGVIYYDTTAGAYRGRTAAGWVTFTVV
jgi:hypothetical protein